MKRSCTLKMLPIWRYCSVIFLNDKIIHTEKWFFVNDWKLISLLSVTFSSVSMLFDARMKLSSKAATLTWFFSPLFRW